MNSNLYLDFHIIQTVPPSCVNRDDTGSPKSAVYGGVMRARVSSQAWKHAMRKKFKDLFTADRIGYRTKKLPEMVTEQMCAENGEIKPEDAAKTVKEILELAGVKAGSEKKDALFFVSARQVCSLASLAVKYHQDSSGKKEKEKKFKADLIKAVNEEPSVDILLFGRMAASNPSLNYDAASQVAHSISTHAVSNEYDYFTAVDDYDEEDATRASHLGTVEFNSSTLYRYATVNIRELEKNLGAEELKMAVKGFGEAFIQSMPTGRQNSFANKTLPDMVYVTLRRDQPINLAGAFEKPVKAGTDGYVADSEKALIRHARRVYKDYEAAPLKAWVVGGDDDDFAQRVNLTELLQEIEREMELHIAEGK